MIEFKSPTPTQQKARQRNHHIRMLRGLYANARGYLDPDLVEPVYRAVDQQLLRLGAQPETQRRFEDREAMKAGHGYYKGYGKRRHFVHYEDTKR